MKYLCTEQGCQNTLTVGKNKSFHGDECFKCGGKLGAVSFEYQQVEYDLLKIRKALHLHKRGGPYSQKDVARMASEDATYVSRMIRGTRPMKDNLAGTLISLLQREGHQPDQFTYDGDSASLDAVEEALSDKADSLEGFPFDDALKVQESTRQGAEGGEVEATFGFRRLKLWQRAFLAFVKEGHKPAEALGASYWAAHAYKLEDEGQLYAVEIFQRVFGFDPVKPTDMVDSEADVLQHPMEPVAKLLAEAGFHLFAYGETGDGKSFAIERVAREVSQHGDKVAVISGHRALSTEDFVSSGAARGDGAGGTETFTELRTLPLCMKRGMPLVMDEPCVVRPSILMALQRVLESGELFVPEADMEIQAQPGFRVFLTDNTRGLAEEPRYKTREVLDEAFRDRFLFLHFDSMPEKMATAILEQDATLYEGALSSGDTEALEDTDAERQTEIVEDDTDDAPESENTDSDEDDGVNWSMLGIDE